MTADRNGNNIFERTPPPLAGLLCGIIAAVAATLIYAALGQLNSGSSDEILIIGAVSGGLSWLLIARSRRNQP